MENLENFRKETRAWLEANCPPEMRRPSQTEDDTCWGGRHWVFQSDAQRQWLERMGQKGWTVPEWPREYGGGGLSRDEAKILRQEMRALNCRSPLDSFGLWMLGPALLKDRSEEPKRAPRTRAISFLSTARRFGPHTRTRPTGFFAWCAPTPTRPSTKASVFCYSTWKAQASRPSRSL